MTILMFNTNTSIFLVISLVIVYVYINTSILYMSANVWQPLQKLLMILNNFHYLYTVFYLVLSFIFVHTGIFFIFGVS